MTNGPWGTFPVVHMSSALVGILEVHSSCVVFSRNAVLTLCLS